MPCTTRQTARKKFDGKCFFCPESCWPALQAHRIFPGAQGGTYTWANTLTLCANCHCKVHAGLIRIDRRYLSTTGPVLHCWVDDQELYLPCP